MKIIDKKFVKQITKGMSKREKHLLLLAILVSRPPIVEALSEGILQLQEMPEPKATLFYQDLKT